MTTLPLVDQHDEAVLTALRTIGRQVGHTQAPTGALERLLKDPDVDEGGNDDYLVLFPLPGGSRDGSLEDPFADIDLPYQITVVGYSAAGVRWIVSRIEPALATLAVPGRSVVLVIPDDAGGGARPDPDVPPDHKRRGVVIATPRYRILTTPA